MIAARPTTYNGIQMRSRTEAAWAARFDQSGLGWQYEPQCFASQDGQYLPDFRIASSRWPIYIEIKGAVAKGDLASVLDRMEIIFESEPVAVLVLYVGTPDNFYGYHRCIHDSWQEYKRPESALGAHRRPNKMGLTVGTTFPAGTMDMVVLLDRLDAPADVTVRQARLLLKLHAEPCRSEVLAAAVRFRRERMAAYGH